MQIFIVGSPLTTALSLDNKDWCIFGESYINKYFVSGEWKEYLQK
jgi:hypothetical protein